MGTLAAHFEAVAADELLPPSWNVAPTQDVYAVASEGPHRCLATFHWGLVPPWAKSPGVGARMINARAESLTTSGAFRAAYRRRRCLVPADGFYEWQARAGSRAKQPWYLSPADGRLLAMAGLWERWVGPRGADHLRSLTIVTTRAGPDLAGLHDRMPVLLAPQVWDLWLDGGADTASLEPLLVPAPGETLTRRPVSRAVNDVRNDGSELLAPYEPDELDPGPTSLPGLV